MVYEVICAECKGINQTINRESAESAGGLTQYGNYAGFCSACLNDVSKDCGFLHLWGKDAITRNGKPKRKKTKFSRPRGASKKTKEAAKKSA